MPVAPQSPSRVEPDLCVVARCNDSLGSRGRRTAFCLVAAVSLALGAGFAAAGAWPVLPYSVLEITALAVAFVCLERRAREWERLTVEGDRVIVERARAGRVERQDWNRRWVRVETTSGQDGEPGRIRLHSGGRTWDFGATLPAPRRGELARQLRRLTGS